jgi:glycosyltransferase involved in cell wall biosynthesis
MHEARPTRIWVIEIGEPLPLSGESVRLMRAGQVCAFLRARGADVTWWASDFDHINKRPFNIEGKLDAENSLRLDNGVRLRFLHGRPYARNVSFTRILNGREVAADFARQAEAAPAPPDAILCFYPTVELASCATEFGARRNIPVFIDVRDLWPDAFVDVSPLPAAITRLLLIPMERAAKKALAAATGLSSISEPMLEWAVRKAGRPEGPNDAVIPLAFDRNSASPEMIADEEDRWRAMGLRLNGSEHIFCLFGTLSNVPEFQTLIDAIEHVPPIERDSLRLVVCGIGERLPWLREQAAIHPQLIVPGRVGPGAIAAMMKHSTGGLLIYPARPDLLKSYPNKVGEFLSAGLPIVSTLGGLAGDMLTAQGCGLVTPNNDGRALARSMTALMTNPELRARMSEKARHLFHAKFDATQVYSRFASRLVAAAEGAPDRSHHAVSCP